MQNLLAGWGETISQENNLAIDYDFFELYLGSLRWAYVFRRSGLVVPQGGLPLGLILLVLYSLGFAIPILLAGYASQPFRHRIRVIHDHPERIRMVSGVFLIGFGCLSSHSRNATVED